MASGGGSKGRMDKCSQTDFSPMAAAPRANNMNEKERSKCASNCGVIVGPYCTGLWDLLAKRTGNGVIKPPIINLPPASCSYVVIFSGVPQLKTGQRESHENLTNKCLHWRTRYRNFPLTGPATFF